MTEEEFNQKIALLERDYKKLPELLKVNLGMLWNDESIDNQIASILAVSFTILALENAGLRDNVNNLARLIADKLE